MTDKNAIIPPLDYYRMLFLVSIEEKKLDRSVLLRHSRCRFLDLETSTGCRRAARTHMYLAHRSRRNTACRPSFDLRRRVKRTFFFFYWILICEDNMGGHPTNPAGGGRKRPKEDTRSPLAAVGGNCVSMHNTYTLVVDHDDACGRLDCLGNCPPPRL